MLDEVRGRGNMLGIELVKDHRTREPRPRPIAQALYQRPRMLRDEIIGLGNVSMEAPMPAGRRRQDTVVIAGLTDLAVARTSRRSKSATAAASVIRPVSGSRDA